MNQAVDVREYDMIDSFMVDLQSHNIQGSQAGRTSVPKFASFRPKEPAAKGDEDEKKKTKNVDQSLRDRTHAKKSERPKHHHKHRAEESRNGRHKDAGRQPSTSDTITVASPQHEIVEGDFLVIDKIGDPKNVVYGALDRYATPTYFRGGAGTVIGAEPGVKIDRTISNEKGVVLCAQEGNSRHEKQPLRSNGRADMPVFRVKKRIGSNKDFIGSQDFIPLGSTSHIHRKQGDDATKFDLSSSDDQDVDYKSILGKSKKKNASDSDLELFPEADMSENGQPGASNDLLRQKNAEITRHLESKPDDVEMWLRLIHNQEISISPRPTEAERRSNADIKISIYEKALLAVKNPEHRQDLLAGMIQEGGKIWDSTRLATQWNSILRQHPHFPKLWANFLEFKQTTFSVFRYEGVRDAFGDCIITSHKCMQNANEVAQRRQIYDTQILILLRMTLYMREAGFLENAFAVWQALLELEYFVPSTFHSDGGRLSEPLEEAIISEFKQFWESEVPRIGEDGAQGWAAFSRSGGSPPEPVLPKVDKVKNSDKLFRSWMYKERQALVVSRQPARTIDDGIENDPYRVVIFSDIEPYLITSPSPDCQRVLLEAFLCFCQLPSYRANEAFSTRLKDGFVSNEALNSGERDGFSDHVAGNRFKQELQREPFPEIPQDSAFDFTHLQCQLDSEVLFARKGTWFSAFDSWQSNKCSPTSLIDPMWALNVLRDLLRSIVGDDLMAEYILALELCLSPESARKSAKKLLKQRTSSLRLYNTYALIEYRLSNPSKGEGTLIAAINMSKDLDGVAGLDNILLWRTWIWELLSEGKSWEALLRLLTYEDARIEPFQPHHLQETAPNPTRVLRVENGLTAFRDHTLSFQSREHSVLSMECLFLLAYLKDTSTLTAALASFSANLALLSTKSPTATSAQESLHQSLAHLLHHHSTHTSSFKPSEIRTHLAESIVLFPSNTIFLSLYAWNESRFRIDDRVRAIVHDILLNPTTTTNNNGKRQESITPHFFAIHTELTRGVAFGSNDHAIRASFERAVDSRSGAHCGGLWKMYFQFEHSRGSAAEARNVWYRGIKACPWIKALYMLPFEYLQEGPGAMREAELRGVYEMMVEKELRVHVDLEELMEGDEGG